MREIDWIKGQTKTAYRIDLPKGYHLEGYVAQHDSGNVTVNQSVSLTWGSFNLNTMQIKGIKDSGNLAFMDKLNKILQWELEA